MDTNGLAAQMAKGRIIHTHETNGGEEPPWNAHPRFPGVWMKLLVGGKDTDGALSCHMVRIDPGATLEEHVHEGQWELHEVLEGEGEFRLDAGKTPYSPGCMSVIPKGMKHRVTAGSSGLVLLAKFFPALV